MASVQPESGRLPTSNLVLKARIILWKTNPDLTWMAWSGFRQMRLVWKQAGVQESMGPVLGRTHTGCCQFPTFRFCCVRPQTARIILCKTSLDPVGFWLTVSGFGQTDLVRKQASVQESFGPLLANTSNPVWIGCGSDPACLLGVVYLWLLL